MTSAKKILLVIAGPTASGKTALAIQLAKKFQTEIISADSRQVYREMKIGTARPDENEMDGIVHHCMGHVSIHDEYHAGKFEGDALNALEKIYADKDIAIVCGGTGLYLSAMLNGFDQLPERDEKTRKELESELEEKGIHSLQKRLKELDPEFYQHAEIQNPQRLIRAIEVCMLSGKTHRHLRTGVKKNRPFKPVFFTLNPEREVLYSRINARVDRMISSGLEKEAEKLFPHRELNALQTVGYTELFNFFDGKISREKAIDLIKQHTRNYAKRQLTWFRKQKEIVMLSD